MAAAGWIDYTANSQRFTLPAEHAVFSAQEIHPMYLGGALEPLGAYGETIPKIMGCFHKGGGTMNGALKAYQTLRLSRSDPGSEPSPSSTRRVGLVFPDGPASIFRPGDELIAAKRPSNH